MRIPERGLSRAEIFERLERIREHDTPWREGRCWAYVYDPGPEAESVIKDAFAAYLSENGLDPTAFPSALQLENEVIAMAVDHLNGGPETVGSFTSGGTVSTYFSSTACSPFDNRAVTALADIPAFRPSITCARISRVARQFSRLRPCAAATVGSAILSNSARHSRDTTDPSA